MLQSYPSNQAEKDSQIRKSGLRRTPESKLPKQDLTRRQALEGLTIDFDHWINDVWALKTPQKLNITLYQCQRDYSLDKYYLQTIAHYAMNQSLSYICSLHARLQKECGNIYLSLCKWSREGSEALSRPSIAKPHQKTPIGNLSRREEIIYKSDTAWKMESSEAGGEWSFSRARDGSCESNSQTFEFVKSPLVAEGLALRAAMEHALHETTRGSPSNQTLISAIKEGGSISDLHGIIADISKLSLSFESISFHFVGRENLTRVDELAKNALRSIVQTRFGSLTPIGPPTLDSLHLRVSDLLDQHSDEWNLQSHLPQYEASIQQLIASSLKPADSQVWLLKNSGIYTTKSGYRVLAQSKIQKEPHTFNWMLYVWSVQTSPQLKHFFWRALNCALPVGELLASQGVMTDLHCKRCGDAESICHILWNCRKICSIPLPHVGNSKSLICIIDGAWKLETKCSGMGWLIVSASGIMMEQKSEHRDFVGSALMVEIFALCSTLKKARASDIHHLCINSDSNVLINALRSRTDLNEIADFFHDIRNRATLFISLFFNFIFCTTNIKTDILAKLNFTNFCFLDHIR
ncbi:unnamed protein product [Thlaspi arvense]|uniref:RNase H type-1 domain-containing protein n=1 Tax=Thlaspi arvense TaxID=13288 RepID=A0AAU9SIU2_THLAR|nr:unnamed protein product [Thlaspi arvense]